MVEFVMHVSRPDGSLPLIGDDDGGRALALRQTTYHRFQDALSTAAVLFGRGDFKARAGGFAEETLWLLGERAWESFAALPAENPAERAALFPAAGYCIQRSSWETPRQGETFVEMPAT